MAKKTKDARKGHAVEWDSAFYRFAEGVRGLTGGAINYKIVFSLVGESGRYVNHPSAYVRKRTAPAFSRLIHSSRYADVFRDAYGENNQVFADAGIRLARLLREHSSLSEQDLFRAVFELFENDVYQGLRNECQGGRTHIRLGSVEQEIKALANWCNARMELGRLPLEELLAVVYHLLAFGAFDQRFARALLLPTLDVCPIVKDVVAETRAACLVRVGLEPSSAIAGVWEIDPTRPFTVGRYSDCDAIESSPYISRLHCRIFCIDGAWHIEDAHSLHGVRVVRVRKGGQSLDEVFKSKASDSLVFKLEFGDRIILADCATYWFKPLAEGAID